MRRKKPDWVMEQDKGLWRLYAGGALILALVAYVLYEFQVKQQPSIDSVVEQLLDDGN